MCWLHRQAEAAYTYTFVLSKGPAFDETLFRRGPLDTTFSLSGQIEEGWARVGLLVVGKIIPIELFPGIYFSPYKELIFWCGWSYTSIPSWELKFSHQSKISPEMSCIYMKIPSSALRQAKTSGTETWPPSTSLIARRHCASAMVT